MTHLTQKAKDDMFKAGLGAGTATWCVAFVMTDSTVLTEFAKDTMSAYTDLDEMDGVDYDRQALGGVTVTRNDSGRKVYFTCNLVSIAGLQPGTRQIAAAVVYRGTDDPGDDATNKPYFVFTGGFPKTPDGVNPFTWRPSPTAGGVSL